MKYFFMKISVNAKFKRFSSFSFVKSHCLIRPFFALSDSQKYYYELPKFKVKFFYIVIFKYSLLVLSKQFYSHIEVGFKVDAFRMESDYLDMSHKINFIKQINNEK